MLTSEGSIAVLERPSIGEVAPAALPNPAAATAQRFGFDSDVPYGGATKLNPGGDYPDGRQAFMTSLYVAYTGCPWLSAPIDAIARTITAGGLQVLPSTEAEISATTDKPPKQVVALQNLLKYCNPHQDIIQLLRGVVTDMGIYGDAFIEVVWLLGLPVALYSLDPATMTIEADEHGVVTGYDQVIDSREVHFDPRQIIHISMDAPRGSLYGMGIAQKALLPVTTWLFAAALIKETMRKGDPPHLHMDFPLEVQPDEVRAWRGQYSVRNLGIGNIGNPITTRGGVSLTELGLGKIGEYLSIQDACREAILSEAGVPPAKVGVIDSGNIGGGTGTSQDKTFKVNTCGPIEQIVLEKLNFALTQQAFGITGWELVFAEVDWRDDAIIENIRDQRLKNGSWTLNDYLADIGKPTIGADGDVHVLVDRQNLVLWKQIGELSQAKIDSLAKTGAGATAPGGVPDPLHPDDPDGGDDPDSPDGADDGTSKHEPPGAGPKAPAAGKTGAAPPAKSGAPAKKPTPSGTSKENAVRYRELVAEHYARLMAEAA